jgi:hypothetical protein
LKEKPSVIDRNWGELREGLLIGYSLPKVFRRIEDCRGRRFAASGKNQILSEVHMPQFFLRR